MSERLRILILSQYYDPEPIPKPRELAEGLKERGHDVVVLTGLPNYPYGRLYAGYALRPWIREEVGGIPVFRLLLYPDHSKSSLRRILNYTSFMATAALLGSFLSGPADVMFVRHPPLTIGLAAIALSKLRRIPFVYGVADLWPEALVAAGMLADVRLIALLERMERFVYRHAAAVAPVSPAMLERLAAKVPREKLHVLPDWADERLYHPLPPDPELAGTLRMVGRFNVVFGGQLGIVQRLDTVIEAARLLKDHPRIQFVLVGDGVEKPRLEQEIRRLGVPNVRLTGRLPAREMARVYALADILLVHLSADPVFGMSIPGKVYAYLACEKPILAAIAGSTAHLVEGAGAGVACPPEDPGAMARAVLRLAEMPPARRQEMGKKGRNLFLRDYARSVVLGQFERLLHTIARSQTS